MTEHVGTKSRKVNPGEKNRLEKLQAYDVIEECGDSKFKKITRLAARFCGTDYAGIHFIDQETQYCKVSFGTELADMDREDSVCQYTIQSDEPLVIEDLREDERFQDASYVTGAPYFVSYAGTPLITKDGYRIGSICVMDQQRRSFTDDQIDALQLLADEVVTRLELHLKNKQLEKQKEETNKYARNRDAMIKEIHHRLKNNLSYIIGILDLELMNTDDEWVRQLIQKIQKRIMSVVTIHQHLYESKNLEQLDLKSYLKELMEDIQRSFTDQSKQIDCTVKGESLQLSNEYMTPFGLLMSELLINAFKHAFVGREKGTIEIILSRHQSDYKIDVIDDGVGLPDEFEIEGSHSMGTQLISSFLEQLNAEIEWTSNDGTHFTIIMEPK